ncbi:MAG: GatB/YqeY domain-containing protein [Hamadaea sp.]|uniref:GatB/YqeY domain-containing protein n=1 Tax=Hamadaea sp. TaxID=2024425 RepID=UPI0017A4E580|nr:GatB/YqeY domain-containing protein [Hamadaea sp.]NUR74033.1 GatB/YqeY domain-containing protein [Hamadaea sp.]NUT19489.1 GatB/YqeY domain-containing protein [Hamadaea sp.]
MSTLKDRLTADMRNAMKARDETVTRTLRMALAAIGNAEVAGKVKKELTDSEVLTVLTKEAKKRAEASEAFANAGRPEQAAAEKAEEAVLMAYLPQQLTDDELTAAVTTALAGGDFSGPGAMGPAMKAARAAVGDKADGSRVSAEVKRQLGL